MRLILPLTRKCNLNCEYCYVDKRGGKSLPFLIGLRAINFLMRNNQNRDVELIFTGGEPLLEWEKMKKLILYVKHSAIKENIHIKTLGFPTNGLLLNEEILSFCLEKGIKIAVSVDGRKNKRRTINGFNSFFLVRKKFPLLLKYKEIIRIRLTIWPSYANKLLPTFEELLKTGFVKFDIQPVIGVGWSEKNRNVFLNNLIESFKVIKENKGIDLKSSRDFSISRDRKINCYKANSEFLVDIDGRIYPCGFFLSIPLPARKKFLIGDVIKGINPELSLPYKNFRICQNNLKFSNIKNKCNSCFVSDACFKLCLGFNIKKKKFDLKTAEENWLLMRGIENIFSKSDSPKIIS